MTQRRIEAFGRDENSARSRSDESLSGNAGAPNTVAQSIAMTGQGSRELLALAERCGKATGPDRDLDRAIMDAVFQPWRGFAGARDAYTDEPIEDSGWSDEKGSRWIGAPILTASLDAAMSLVPKGDNSGGEIFRLESWDGNGVHAPHVRASAWVAGAPRVYAATPALALCAAALAARSSVGEG